MYCCFMGLDLNIFPHEAFGTEPLQTRKTGLKNLQNVYSTRVGLREQIVLETKVFFYADIRIFGIYILVSRF